MEETHMLSELIRIDSEKCVNCHLCIGACPVKYCNKALDYSKGIQINPDLCIGCGACIKACTHNARIPIDDTDRFFDDLRKGIKIATLVAPAVDVNFPKQLHKLLAWLKSKNVELNFDVSFGAEITTYQYFLAANNGAKKPIIAQPCPSVVNYIEIYKPNLIPHLAPTGSPTMDMATWVHQKHPGYKLAFISPCLAKKREFEDPNTHGKVSYNVTIQGIKDYLESNGVDLESFPEIDFDGPIEAEKGLLFSQPGGLFETFKKYNMPLKMNQVRITEGKEIYLEFFDELESEIKKGDCDVIIVDVLNCQHGCNRGTGTRYNERTTNEVLKLQVERMEKHNSEYFSSEEYRAKLDNILHNMSDIDFSRNYSDKSGLFSKLTEPTDEIIEIVNLQMGKYEPKDIKNCGACGYFDCKSMIKACINDLYLPEQCHHYLESFYVNHQLNNGEESKN